MLADFVMAVRLAQSALERGDVTQAKRVLALVVAEHPRASACYERGIAMAMETLAAKSRGRA